ncbi:uncharacterized protein PV07_12543 [Cladophialophora immunda]|uniref:Uncharacterized protein n=1 Tax=Cladophialophora immunda TaxID=569365 RepID=A0A0D2BUJ2_9EURO|nr:uncharacterized protein PV07_12543 [Cladophialophora immunda]KIW22060.1 hypothetical protein PV07_12543 [Cladophialophora immunda]
MKPSMHPDAIASSLSLSDPNSPPWFIWDGVEPAARQISPHPGSSDKKRAQLEVLEELKRRPGASSTTKKRNAPPADNGAEQGKGDKEGNQPQRSKKAKVGVESQVRWDCCFNRSQIGVVGTGYDCATTGFLFDDLWAHLRRDHYRCYNCALRFKDHDEERSHFRDRFDDRSLCIFRFHGNPSFHLGYEDMQKVDDAYKHRDPENLQKTWEAWFLIIHAKYSLGPPPSGINQGTISSQAANIIV